MSESIIIDKALNKEENYKQLLPQIKSLVDDENDLIANLANICGALKYAMEGFFWVGFYFVKDDESVNKPDLANAELVLGPFQGPVACTRIQLTRGGVCAAAVKERKTIVVEDVNAFPGHIACNADSKSEIVIPVFKEDNVIAVLDVDSDSYSMFDLVDSKYLEEVCSVVSQLIKT